MNRALSPLYLDANATTPLRPEALEAMRPFLEERFGNPSSIHSFGREARAAVDDARDRIAATLGAKSHEIVFTSGGTESNNLAILGAARAACAEGKKGRHVVTAVTEHHAVLQAVDQLRALEGFEATILPVDGDGRVSVTQVVEALRPDTALVSIMSANNETGTLQPVREIGEALRQRGVLFHCDAVQSFGKERVRLEDRQVDLLSLSAHKFYGPKGAGVLYVRAGIPLRAVQVGGFHENQRRAGTEDVAAIAGMAIAAELAQEDVAGGVDNSLFTLIERLWDGLKSCVPGVRRNGDPERRVGNTLNVSFEGCDGELLLIAFDLAGLAVSSGSACMVGSVQPSHVLLAMGVPQELARSTIRFSLGRDATAEGIDEVLRRVPEVVERVRGQKMAAAT